jgi:GNAT superfamily N-acetyltransferase
MARQTKPIMPHHEFVVANVASHREELTELNIEYLSWVFTEVESLFGVPVDEVAGMPVHEYVPTVIDKVCGDPPPRGIFYLIKTDGQLAGMGGLRLLRPEVAEVKRIYIRPEFRGQRLGELTLNRLLDDARAFGYKRVFLDTGVFMKSAHRLYEASGFSDCAAYDGVEVPAEFHSRWRFMERTL